MSDELFKQILKDIKIHHKDQNSMLPYLDNKQINKVHAMVAWGQIIEGHLSKIVYEGRPFRALLALIKQSLSEKEKIISSLENKQSIEVQQLRNLLSKIDIWHD